MYVPHCYVAAASNIDLALLLFSPLGLFLSLLDLWQCQSTRWYWKLVPVSVLFSVVLFVCPSATADIIVPAGNAHTYLLPVSS